VAAEVLKDFLARLGFEVDEAGAADFKATLAESSTKVLAFGAAVQAMAVGAYAAIYQIASSKSELLTMADAVGVPVSKLEELAFVAEQSGSSADKLYSSVESVSEALAGASIGQGGLETFHRLGISIRDSNNELRDSVDVLMEVGDKVKDMDPTKASMYLNQLGIDPSMLRMLTSDVSGLSQAYQDMYQAVGVDADQAAEDSRAFVGEVKGLFAMVKLIGDGIAGVFVGDMGRDIARFRKLIQDNVGKIIPVLKTIIDVVVRIGKAFFALTTRLVTWVGMIIDWFGKLDSGTQALILGVLGIAAAWRYLNLAFLATPLGMLLAGLFALLALVDDFMVWKDGGDSFIDWGPWADDIDKVVDGVAGLLKMLGRLWDLIKGPLFEVVGMWAKGVVSALGSLLNVLGSVVSAIVKLFQGDLSGAMSAMGEAFKHVFEMVTNILGNIKEIVGFILDKMGGVLSWAADGIGDMLGFGDDDPPDSPITGNAPTLGVAGMRGAGDTIIHSTTQITVDGSGDPAATARSVGRGQNRANADLVRHAKGAAR